MNDGAGGTGDEHRRHTSNVTGSQPRRTGGIAPGGSLSGDALASYLAGLGDEVPAGHRSGLIALAGRPNVGKSTLLNQLVGTKVAIVTDVPGTTRNAIRGVVTRDDAQLVLLDTPGLAKPRTLLSRRLNELVEQTWEGVDAICLLVDVAGGIGDGDAYLARRLADVGTPVVAVANKEDLVADKERLLPALDRLSRLLGPGREVAEVVPVSARTGFNVDVLLDVLVGLLPEGGRLFPGGHLSDQPEQQLAAEIVREKLIARMRDEVPHSIAVVVEIREADDRDDPGRTSGGGRPSLLEVDATIHVERDSQKGIVIGKGGATLKAAATEARTDLEVLFGARVFLRTHVRVTKEWQRDPRALRRLGY